MALPQINIGFGGIPGIRGMCYSMTRGVLPSVATLYVVAQDNFDPGIQTLTYGIDSNTMSLSGCSVANNYVRKHWDGKHPLMAVHLFDRRWKWRLSTISGDYNRRKADGTLDTTTQKTPADIANLLGTALGETIDTSRMPTGVFPRVKWNNQRADLSLQWLCDYVACDVVLNPISGYVEIWPLGTGQNSPTGTTEVLPKYRFVPRSNVPGRIEAHGGDSLYQTKLKLTAVAHNQNGDQKTLANWEALSSSLTGTESPLSFPDISNTTNRTNAYEDYLRAFKIVGQQDGTLGVPNCQASISSVDQYLLNDYLLDVEKDLDGYYRQLPYYLDGDYYAYTDLPNNASSMRFTGGSRLFTDRRLVQTAFPVFKLSSSGAYQEPALYCTTSYKVRDTDYSTVHISRSVGSSGTGTLILRRPEVFATYSTSTLPGAQASTEAQASQELYNYCNIFQQRYASNMASEITYGGFFSGSLDGIIAQATWEFHPTKGVTTKVCEQEELDIYGVSRNERYRRLALDRLVEAYS